MARRDLSRTDAADYERSSLEYVLKKEKEQADDTRYLSVDEALHGESVYEVNSSRDVTRVLFISQDESLLNPTKQSLDGYTNLTDLFDEVHVLILRQGIPAKNPVLRIAKNLWIYTATAKDWWQTPEAGRKLIEKELVFADGFRADIIVARDPFESAYLAKRLGSKYSRPVQVHVLDDYTKADFLLKSRHNRWRRYLPRFTLRDIRSVRTSTKALSDLMQKRFAPENLDILPKFNNYEALIKTAPSIELRERYKPFVFILLYIGKLDHAAALHRVIDAARFGLKNPHIGLLVLGNGPARKEFEERARVLGVREQVVFIPDVKDDVPYLKSANVLIVPDTNPESEEVVLRGAAAGIPMVLARTKIREDLFTDGENALLCDEAAVDEYSLKINILMNDIPLRRQLTEAATDMIESRFHEDPIKYRAAYRESIEEVLFLPEIVIEPES